MLFVALCFVRLAVAAPPPGVVVEEAPAGFAAAAGGVRPGDVLTRWERAASPPANPLPADGALASPFDLDAVELEQASRGALTLHGRRGEEALVLRMPLGEWRLKARPPMDEAGLAAYEAARMLIGGAEHDRGVALWQEQAAAMRATGDVRANWVSFKAALAAAARRKWEVVDPALEQARVGAEAAGDLPALAQITSATARAQADRNQAERAEALYRDAAALYQRLSWSLAEARVFRDLVLFKAERGKLAAGEPDARRAVELAEKAAPGSVDLAASLSSLGNVLWSRGALDESEACLRRALEIQTRLTPESLELSRTLTTLGIVADIRGDFVAAEENHRRALALAEKLAPNTARVAAVLNNLGAAAWNRGDVAAAEASYLRAVAIREKLGPPNVSMAGHLHNLAGVASKRGDWPAAEDYLKRAVDILDRVAPGSPVLAVCLNGLGLTAMEKGDLAAADAHHRRALSIAEAAAPDGMDAAFSLHSLGRVALRRGDPAAARDRLQRAAAILEPLAPRGMYAGHTALALGDTALETGDLTAAAAHYRRALEIRHELAPGSGLEAEACRQLAVVERRQQHPKEALELYGRALQALESQRRTLGGSDEARSRFATGFAACYREAIELLLEQGRPEEAFHVLERYRARGFLSLLAERDIVFSADVPPDLDRERRMANAAYDRAFARLADGKGEALAERRTALEKSRRRQAAVQDQIRAASARLSALEYPEPLDLTRSRRALDPGTLLLSYSVGEAKSHLFAVGPGPDEFRVVDLDVTRPVLREEVADFRALIKDGGSLRRKALEAAARRLSDRLLAPVAPHIARSERVLIVADGPLHLLPFAALADPSEKRAFRYLVEAKPLHAAASATVFAEIAARRRATAAPRLVAFGDPDYSSAAAPQAIKAARERGLDLGALPASRREVRELQQIFGDGVKAYLGEDATEGRAKATPRDTSVLHFACHAIADEKAPLDSALALSLRDPLLAGGDNGLLQAWEVFEQVRLDADLVTLSACDTALGKEMSGEGMLGLTRAFVYAGARSVLASLWGVADDSTATLMSRFYSHLRKGRSKDVALRAAQIEMLRRAPSSHPYRWAAFQVIGDWR